MKRLLVLLFVLLLIIGVAASFAPVGISLQGGESVSISCPTNLLIDLNSSNTNAVIQCLMATITPTISPPTATPTPTPSTATPTVSPSGSIMPYLNAPMCVHDPKVWHGLWDYKLGCWYDHTHGDDPSLADKYFGPLGALWGGQQISFPFNSGPTENALKHPGYKVSVRMPGYHPWPPCGVRDQNDITGAHSDNCIIASRVEYHAVGSLLDNVHRYHSFWIELLICKGISDPNPPMSDCGILRTGGIADYAQLQAPHYSTRIVRQGGTVDFGNGQTTTYTPDGPDLPSQSGEPYMFNVPFTQSKVDFLNRYPISALPGQPSNRTLTIDQWALNDFDCEPHPATDPCHNAYVNLLIQIADSFTLVDPTNLNTVHWICYGKPNCEYNASVRGIDQVGARVLQSWDPSGNGFVTVNGFTDQWGNPSNCTSISNTCVPWVLEHVPVGMAATRSAEKCDCETWEYDYYYDPATGNVNPVPGKPGSSWLTVNKIKHPN